MANVAPMRVQFRPVAPNDALALWRVHEQCAAHDQVDALSSIEYAPTHDDLEKRLTQVSDEGLVENWLVAQIGDEVVGYSRISWWRECDGLWLYLTVGWVVPS